VQHDEGSFGAVRARAGDGRDGVLAGWPRELRLGLSELDRRNVIARHGVGNVHHGLWLDHHPWLVLDGDVDVAGREWQRYRWRHGGERRDQVAPRRKRRAARLARTTSRAALL
jgi:hypothetical protein